VEKWSYVQIRLVIGLLLEVDLRRVADGFLAHACYSRMALDVVVWYVPRKRIVVTKSYDEDAVVL